jgi:hypothetical protein
LLETRFGDILAFGGSFDTWWHGTHREFKVASVVCGDEDFDIHRASLGVVRHAIAAIEFFEASSAFVS